MQKQKNTNNFEVRNNAVKISAGIIFFAALLFFSNFNFSALAAAQTPTLALTPTTPALTLPLPQKFLCMLGNCVRSDNGTMTECNPTDCHIPLQRRVSCNTSKYTCEPLSADGNYVGSYPTVEACAMPCLKLNKQGATHKYLYFVGLDPSIATLNRLGDYVSSLNAWAENKDGTVLPAVRFSYGSDNPQVVEVSSNGFLSAIKEGKATIKATALYGNETKFATSEITVKIPPTPPPSAKFYVRLNPSSATLDYINEKIYLSRTAKDQDGKILEGVIYSYESSDSGIVEVNDGFVTAVAEGKATITITATLGNKTAHATSDITVKIPAPSPPPPATKLYVTVSPSAVTLNYPGERIILDAIAKDQDGKILPDAKFNYMSGSPEVATVSLGGGLVTAVAEGTATITVIATYQDKIADVKSVITVKIPPSPPPSAEFYVTVSPSVATLNYSGAYFYLRATATDQTKKELYGVKYSYSSSKEAVATVSSDGFVTAVAEGTATITVVATYKDKTETATSDITVSIPPTPSTFKIRVVLDSLSETLNKIGQTFYLGAKTVDENGAPVSGATFTYKSETPSVAKADGPIITAIGQGRANITVTATLGTASDTATCAVTVNIYPPSTSLLFDLEVYPIAANLTYVGATQQLHASATADDGTSKAAISYASSNADIAKVDSNGLVTAVGAGTATITVTATLAISESVMVVINVSPTNTNFTCDTRTFKCIPYTTASYAFGNYGDINTCGEGQEYGHCIPRYYCEFATKLCKTMPRGWYSPGFSTDFSTSEGCAYWCAASANDYICNKTTKKCEERPGQAGGDNWTSCSYWCSCWNSTCPAVGSGWVPPPVLSPTGQLIPYAE